MIDRRVVSVVVFLVVSLAQSVRGADIIAKVVLEGQAPANKLFDLGADPYCVTAHKGAKMPVEEVQVGPGGTLKDTFVFVQSGINGTFASPKTPVVLDQSGCHYMPHALALMTGQPLLIKNSDDTLHNIHPLPKVNTPFNIGMPIKGMTQTKTFSKPEGPFRVKCDVHPWMGAYIAVFNHPFFGVSDGQGQVQLRNLPAGTYTIQSWHEKYGPKFQQVIVGASDRKEIVFTYKTM